jgi:alpha-beta hydrolase superfamily lysophospholipase
MTRSGRPGLVAWTGRVLGAIAAVYLGYISVLGSKRLVQPATRPFEAPVEGWPTSPADLDLPWEDVRFTTDDGVTLSGWLIPAERETRAAVVVMHGFTGHRLGELAAFVPWLRRRYHVLQFDFRGHGASGPGSITLGSLERRDVAAAVRFLESRGLGPVALMGLSMGAAVAIVAAPELPVAAVVADAAFAELAHPVASRMRAQRYPLSGLGARLIVGAAWLRAGTRLISPIDRVARIAPRGLLLIAPREDALISWRQSQRLYEAAGEPKELWVVDGAEHATARWVAGAAYEERVLAFLERHLG